MKHCKKFLALVLVLASILSLTLSAGAVAFEYKDAKAITSTAAVDVLSALGVVNGYEDKTFKPEGDVTRAEMAKMLAYILNGGTDVSALYTAACTFADTADHWAKGYIGFCVSAGIINGKNETTFDPDANVTGYEASKMVLGALGYDAAANGLVGKTWDTSAHSLAVNAKLLGNIENYKPAKNLNRNDACQLLYNALTANKVESTGSSSTIGGMTITNSGANVPVTNLSGDYRDAGQADDVLQLVEEAFPTLKKVGGDNDEFGRPTITWALGGETLGTYITQKTLFAQDLRTYGKTIYDLLGKEIPERIIVYRDGVRCGGEGYYGTVETLETRLGAPLPALLGMTKTELLTQADKMGAYGTDYKYVPEFILYQIIARSEDTVYFYRDGGKFSGTNFLSSTMRNEGYYDAETKTLTICNGYYYAGKINSYSEKVTDTDGTVKKGYVTVDNSKGIGVSVELADLKVTEKLTLPGDNARVPISLENLHITLGQEFSNQSYITYYVGQSLDTNNPGAVVLGATVLDVTEEVVTRTTTSTVNGAPQDYNGTIRTDSGSFSRSAKTVNAAYQTGLTYRIYYTTMGGSFFYFWAELADDSNSFYVYNAGKEKNTLETTYTAKVVNAEGVISTVITDQDYGPMGNLTGDGLIGSIVRTDTNVVGHLTMSKIGEKSGNSCTLSVTNSNAIVLLDGKSFTADTNTRFVVGTKDENGNEVFTPYTGINKVPSMVGCKYYAYTTVPGSTLLETIYVIEATIDDASASKEGIAFKTGTETLRTDENGSYYEVAAILNNEVTTVKVSPVAWNTVLKNGFNLFSSYSVSKGDVITGFSTIAGTEITDYAPISAGNITINGTARVAHENILVYTYSLRDKTLAVSSVGALMEIKTGTYTSYFTQHETYTGKPLACIVAVVE